MCVGRTWPDTSLKHTGRRPAGVPAAPLFNTSACCTQTQLPFPWSFCSLSFCWSSCHGHCQLSLDIYNWQLIFTLSGKHSLQCMTFFSPPSPARRGTWIALESLCKCRRAPETNHLTCDAGKNMHMLAEPRIIANALYRNSDNYPKNNTPKHRQACTQTRGRNVPALIAFLMKPSEARLSQLDADE